MTVTLADRKILHGISGSIAAFKAAGWVSALRKEGVDITVVMTSAGARFVSPLTFAALSGNRVHTDLFDSTSPEHIPHISLARESDLILVAPATAHTIARMAHGLADDLLSAVILAAQCPVLVCPAMNCRMYDHPATKANLARLVEYGYQVISPASGVMACGEEGPGRLPPWEEVREAIFSALIPQDLSGQKVVVTAGPTREPLDPARFLSNRSSGRMGYGLARIARRRGADVVLISGPTSLMPPTGVELIRVTTAEEMLNAVLTYYEVATVIVKAAAVADFKPATQEKHKGKKESAPLTLQLERNQDILKELGRKKQAGSSPLLIGFAAETRNHLNEGRRKLQEKNLDLVVVNDIGGRNTGFESPTNSVIILDKSGGEQTIPLLPKEEIAERIWDRIAEMIAES